MKVTESYRKFSFIRFLPILRSDTTKIFIKIYFVQKEKKRIECKKIEINVNVKLFKINTKIFQNFNSTSKMSTNMFKAYIYASHHNLGTICIFY